MKKILTIADKSERVLKILSEKLKSVPYSVLSEALRKKDIRLNGEKINENILVTMGTEITIFVPDNISLKKFYSIFFQDENILIVDKKSGIEVCDGDFNVKDELKKEGINVYPIHRIDRNTMGLVIFAKTKEAEQQLINAFKSGNVEKHYLAEVVGIPKENHAILNGYLKKDKENSLVKVYNKKIPDSIKIQTEYYVLKSSGNTSLLEVIIKEGKTHQIRAHLASIGLPIIGDGKYNTNENNKKYKKNTQSLTAYKIVFKIPTNSFLSYLNNKNFELINLNKQI